MDALFDTEPAPEANPPRTGPPIEVDPHVAAALGRLMSGLNPGQAAAVSAEAATLRILAGAGSGKTRVLTRRIARRITEGECDPRRVLAVTFTRKAAAELRQRIGTLGLRGTINAGTFHAIAYAQLRQRWDERGVTPPELLDRKVGFVARLMGGKSSTLPLDVVSEIEWAKARMISAGDYASMAAAADRHTPIEPSAVAEIYARYEEEKLKRRMVDFDDLLRLATRDIEADPEFAAARRWRFRHLFVDEFQDVNPLQFRLLNAWVGTEPDLCVVGDPNQAIYAWNGADSLFLDQFDTYFPGSTTVELTENYRSSPQILGIANTVLSRTASRRFDLTPNRPDGPIPVVRSFDSETAEASGVARMVRDSHRPGARWSDQAVLVRTNAQLNVFEEAFNSAGIPVRSRGGARFLDQPEIKDALRSMRNGGGSLATRVTDLDAVVQARLESERVASLPTDNEDDAPSEPAEERTGSPDVPGRTGRGPAGFSPPSGSEGLVGERLANVAEFVRLGREFLDLQPEGTSDAFVGWLNSALRNDQSDGGGDAVDLATFHAAKGLEWPTVYLAGLEEGLVPIHFAQTTEAEAEEIRLLYVAITRAERTLVMSWASHRTFGARTLNRKPSPFLETIDIALGMLRSSTRPIDLSAAVASVAAQRSRLQGSERTDRSRSRSGRGAAASDSAPLTADQEAVMQQLRKWRLDTSRLASVPAYVVFSDATLTELARCAPSNHQELLEVPGIGAVKASRFGPDVLRIINGTG